MRERAAWKQIFYRRHAALIRIYVMYPSAPGMAWQVSEEGREAEACRDEHTAIQSACDRARKWEGRGEEVQVHQENANGTWRIIRE